jgi:hypothetical protein
MCTLHAVSLCTVAASAAAICSPAVLQGVVDDDGVVVSVLGADGMEMTQVRLLTGDAAQAAETPLRLPAVSHTMHAALGASVTAQTYSQ